MSEKHDKPRTFEEEKLQAEIDLLKSEKAKIDTEQARLDKENKLPWYKSERMIQAFIAGIVAVPLLWFFFKDVAMPIYQRENLKLAYDVEKVRIENEKQKIRIDSIQILMLEKDSIARVQLENAWDQLKVKEQEYEKNRNDLIQQNQRIIEGLRLKNQNDHKQEEEIKNLKDNIAQLSVSEIITNLPLKLNAAFILEGDGIEYWETPKNTKLFAAAYPDALVFHYDSGESLETSAKYQQADKTMASVHVLIGRDGRMIQLLPFNTIAWHAGKSDYKGRSGYNNFSIGIEFVNAGALTKKDGKFRSWMGKAYEASEVVELTHKNESQPRYWLKYTDEQIKRAEQLCQLLTQKFSIKEILGHEDLAPGRKQDPGPAFPLARFQERYLK